QRAKAATFSELVRHIADGNEQPVGDVERLLGIANRTPEDLTAAVEALVRRRELRAQWDLGPGANARREELAQQVRSIEAKREQALNEFARQIRALEDQSAAELQVAIAADQARSELRRTCTDPALLGESADIIRRREELSTLRCELIGK